MCVCEERPEGGGGGGADRQTNTAGTDIIGSQTRKERDRMRIRKCIALGGCYPYTYGRGRGWKNG